MSGRFVRASKYRHVFGKPSRKDNCYDNLRISRNAWDTNLVHVNPEYLSVNWESGGGGAFAVIPLNEKGKLPDVIPLFRGHTAVVLDTDWHPFNDHIIASGSDDGKIFIWHVPKDFTLFTDAEEPADVAPVSKLAGHSRKVGQVVFNPAAENILASASGDFSIKLWDIGTGQSTLALKHNDIVQSLTWNATGNMLATTSRDKKLRVWDVRQERPAHVGPGHEGAKNSRAVWLGEHNRIATTGFSKMSDRQLALWEPGNDQPIGGFTNLDSISGVCMPFWDDSTNCLYLAGKGDGNIRYFEYENDKFEFLSEYKSADPQRGIAFLPKRGVNLHENEVMRAYKTVNDTYIEPISFTVPRRAETFQNDIFPPTTGLKPAMSALEWVSGTTALPPKIDLECLYEGTALKEVPGDYKTPAAAAAPAPAPAPTPAPAAKPAPKPEPTPVAARTPPPSMAEQKTSMAAAASKFQDKEDVGEEAETSSFEEVQKPIERKRASFPIRVDPAKINAAAQGKIPSPIRSSTPVGQYAEPSPVFSPVVEGSLEQIKHLLETQTKIITAQGDKLNAQNEAIGILAGEVEALKKRVVSGSQEQSERIRQLELELEEARS